LSSHLAGAEAATAATVLEADASRESPASRMACDRLRSGVAVLVYALVATVATAAAAGLASACRKVAARRFGQSQQCGPLCGALASPACDVWTAAGALECRGGRRTNGTGLRVRQSLDGVHAVNLIRCGDAAGARCRDAPGVPRDDDGAKTVTSQLAGGGVYVAGGKHAEERHEQVECPPGAVVRGALAALPSASPGVHWPGPRWRSLGRRKGAGEYARTARSIAPGVPATRASDGNVDSRCCGSPEPSSATGAISSTAAAAALRVDLRRADATRCCCTASSSGSTDVSRVDILRRLAGVSMLAAAEAYDPPAQSWSRVAHWTGHNASLTEAGLRTCSCRTFIHWGVRRKPVAESPESALVGLGRSGSEGQLELEGRTPCTTRQSG
jgi:hypothetical protein